MNRARSSLASSSTKKDIQNQLVTMEIAGSSSLILNSSSDDI